MENNYPSFKPCEGKEPYIFVSYSHADTDIVTEDLNRLHRDGFRIWYDKKLGPSTKWRNEIGDFIENNNCKIFLLFFSKKSIASEFVCNEITLARRRFDKEQLKIYTVFLENNVKSSTNKDLREFIKDRQGNERYNKSTNEYYDKLKYDLGILSDKVRLCPCERDSITLGIGYLPTIIDVINEENMTPKIFETRRKDYVRNILEYKLKTHKIENIFQLTSDKTRARQNLEEVKDFDSTLEKPYNLVSLPLDIGETYISPLRLINGLITQLDENWPPLVTSYSRLVRRNATDLLDDLHYFIEFCWLAWGPSVLTTSNITSEKFVVLQAAYGDEANSLPLIIKQTLWSKIQAKLDANLDATKKSYSGWPVALKNVLLVKPGIDEFFSEIREYLLFKDMFTGDNDDKVALYLPDASDGYACGDVKSLNDNEVPNSFYSTAYVWLMLEKVDKAEFKKETVDKKPELEPGKVLPFFEHANLATKKGLDFLQHCLARKAIYHVLDCGIM